MTPAILLFLHLLLLGAVGLLLAHWLIERRTLRQIVAGKVGPVSNPGTVVHWLAGWIHAHVPRRQDPLFVSRVFHIFGATPTAVLQSGGCCSGKARLYILGLDALGIRSAQITLYHVSGCAQHCAVEVAVNGDRMIVDPLYGLYYTDSRGLPLGLEDLQTGRQPTLQTLPFSTATAYPPYPYYDFDYGNTKTANWTCSMPRRTAYRLLHIVSGGGIDRFRVPAILEWPQILISSFLLAATALMDLLLLLV
jgi:hypothetical protein